MFSLALGHRLTTFSPQQRGLPSSSVVCHYSSPCDPQNRPKLLNLDIKILKKETLTELDNSSYGATVIALIKYLAYFLFIAQMYSEKTEKANFLITRDRYFSGVPKLALKHS